MSAIWKRLEEREEGFTLIELLVVVIIIGILAAIAIPVFLNQRERAWQSETTSAVRNVAMDLEAQATAHGGDYDEVDQDDVTNYLEEELGQDPADEPVDIGFQHVTNAGGDVVGFELCGEHMRISDDHAQYYDSTTGGVQDWDDENACSF